MLQNLLQPCDRSVTSVTNLLQFVTKVVTQRDFLKTVGFMMTFGAQKMSSRKNDALKLRFSIIRRDPCTQIVDGSCMQFRKINPPVEFSPKINLLHAETVEI